MQVIPSWARRKPGQEPTTVKKPAAATPKPAAGPGIRDDAWWLERMGKWQAANPSLPLPRGKLSLWLELPVEATQDDGMPTRPTNLEQILDRFVEGESVRSLAAYLTELFGFRVSHATLRQAFTASPERLHKYNLAREHLAHFHVEDALVDTEKARLSGDYRFSAEFKLKVASKLLPAQYGDKSQIELGGIPGKPMEMAEVKQTPAEAYKKMMGG